MFIIFSVFYILVAAAMIVLILMQRGEGANAGASFGGGSSGTVFGARGSASFLSRSTGGLAVLFFILSLGMAIYLSHSGAPKPASNLGVMSGVDTTTQTKQNTPKPATTAPATAVPKATVPAGSAAGNGKPAQAASGSDVPSATTHGKSAGKAASGQKRTSSGPDQSRH